MLLQKIVSVCRANEQVLVYNLNQPASLCYALMKGVCQQFEYIVNDFRSTQKQDKEQNALAQAAAAGKAERRKIGHSLLKMILVWKSIDTEAAMLARSFYASR